MNKHLKKIAILISIPAFCCALYLYSYNLTIPFYNTALAGFASFYNFIIMSLQFFYGISVAWLYIKLFEFDNGNNLNLVFIFFFVAIVIPLIRFYIILPDSDAGPGGNEMYFYCGDGMFFSTCLATFMIFMSRLDLNRSIKRQIIASILAVMPFLYYLMHIYDIYYLDKRLSSYRSKYCHISDFVLNYANKIYDLLPQWCKEMVIENRQWSMSKFENDQVVLLMFAIVYIPFIVLFIHSILYKILCSDIKYKSQENRKKYKLYDAIAWYTVITPIVLYFCYLINPYLFLVLLYSSPIVFIILHRKMLKTLLFGKRKKKCK